MELTGKAMRFYVKSIGFHCLVACSSSRDEKKTMNIELVIQIGTLISVGVGICGLVFGIRTYKRQSNAQIFIEYTGRYEKIMESFPPQAISARLDSEGSPPEESQELTLAALKYLNLCSEEFYLCKRKYLSKDVWLIWEVELKKTLSSPLYCREWPKLKVEFEAFPEFLAYIENIQKECAANNPVEQAA
jgi:hypothetical protein